MQTLMLTNCARLKISEKTLSLLKHGAKILNSITETRKKWNFLVLSGPDFWMVWRYHRISCVLFVLWSITNDKKRQLDENNVCHCYGNLFKSAILNLVDLIDILKEKVRLKVLQVWMKIQANSLFKTWVNIMKQKSFDPKRILTLIFFTCRVRAMTL